MPPEARWANLKAQARQSTIGLAVDAAMAAIELDNPALEAKMRRLVAELEAQQAEGARLDAAIAENLKALGFQGQELSK